MRRTFISGVEVVQGVIEASICVLARYLEELNTSIHNFALKPVLCAKTTFCADITILTAAPPFCFRACQLPSIADVSVNVKSCVKVFSSSRHLASTQI